MSNSIKQIKINDTVYDLRDDSVSEQINTAVAEKESKIYKQNDEPVGAEDGALWLDMDEEGGGGASVIVDATLTQAGQAADAKAVGDALAGKQPVGDYATENYVDSAISAIPTQDVSGQINTHNTATNSHNDIRGQISSLSSEIASLKSSTENWTFTLEDGSIVTKAVYVGYVPTITFTIDGTSYAAIEGMTWEQWVASVYNTGNYYCSDNYIMTGGGGMMRLNGEAVSASDIIVAGATYTGINGDDF